MIKIAVTGASGMLGHAIVLEAQRRRYDVVAFFHSVPVLVPGVVTAQLDIIDVDAVQSMFSRVRPHVVLHAAAETRVDWCEDHRDDAAQINIEASRNLAQVAARLDATFLYVSTDSVFDGTRGDYKETDTPLPLNVYANTKLEGEEAVLQSLPSSIVVRTNFYGWGGEHKAGLLDWIVRELARGRSIPGFTDVMFCPLLVSDAATVFLDLLERKVSGVFHVVGSEATSKYDFARNVALKFGYDPSLVKPSRLSDVTMRARRPLNTSLNVERLQIALGRDMPGVAEGLSRLV